MGIYYDPGNSAFQDALNSEIYVDKSELLTYTNRMIGTKQKFLCVSRPRRFGKSMAAEMLTAYYSRGCDSRDMFAGLRIASDDSFEKHLNRYDVLYLDMQSIWNVAAGKGMSGQMLPFLQKQVTEELTRAFPEMYLGEGSSLPEFLQKIHAETGKRFLFIIDEWDHIFREEKENSALQEEYITFLRSLFKGTQAENCIHLVYMTGILPIKKYGTQSALNNFQEFTMTDPGVLAEYVGFTETEVRDLCKLYQKDFQEARYWYDGYRFADGLHIYNPKSVVEAMRSRRFKNFWTKTETYESLLSYINMDFDGLKESIIAMLGGEACRIDTGSFQNDMTSFQNKDDILTLLVHLGYLSYHEEKEEVSIPNEEIRQEFLRVVKGGKWTEVTELLRDSEELMAATLRMDAEHVARMIDRMHTAVASVLTYHDENSLACAVMLAYISAKNDYVIVREMPAGKGFADIVFWPKKTTGKPAMIVELKWTGGADSALSQIKEREYFEPFETYGGDVLLVGIHYDRRTKCHRCVMEKWDPDRSERSLRPCTH